MLPSSQNDDLDSRTSATLLSGLRRGDNESRARFYEKYVPAMYGWCRSRWGVNHHDAEDLTADLTVKLLLRFAQFRYDPKKRFRAWLRVVVKHAVADFWRAHSRLKFEGCGRLDEITSDRALTDQVENELLLIEAKDRVGAHYNPTHWKMFIMLVEQGVSPVEVAKQFGVTRNVVDNAKLRALRALREEVARLSLITMEDLND